MGGVGTGVIVPAILGFGVLPIAVPAQDVAPIAEVGEGLVSELRFGVLAHDVTDNREDGVDLNGEILFHRLDFIDLGGVFRPHRGTTINSSGDTSFFYAGLTWTVDLTDQLFVEAAGGGGVHTEELDEIGSDTKPLGSRGLFRVSAGIGFRFGEHSSLSVLWDHYSNAGLADTNSGMDTVGVRYGHRF